MQIMKYAVDLISQFCHLSNSWKAAKFPCGSCREMTMKVTVSGCSVRKVFVSGFFSIFPINLKDFGAFNATKSLSWEEGEGGVIYKNAIGCEKS